MPGKLLFFWDYDTQWGADRSRQSGGPKDWGHLEFENTERLLELHSLYSVPACFAVVAAAALSGERPYHDPVQIRRIHASGHEIGSHAFRHEWLPALSRGELLHNLRRSKETLEQCIGKEVGTFVPPFNQPFDYVAGWSLSLSERREVPGERIDLSRLCEALKESGYRFCRVAYQPLHIRLIERLRGSKLDWPSRLEEIAGVTCVRLNADAGFSAPSLRMLERCAAHGGLVVVYGHPHSLYARNAQNEMLLVPFLKRVQQLVQQRALRVTLPRELVTNNRVHAGN